MSLFETWKASFESLEKYISSSLDCVRVDLNSLLCHLYASILRHGQTNAGADASALSAFRKKHAHCEGPEVGIVTISAYSNAALHLFYRSFPSPELQALFQRSVKIHIGDTISSALSMHSLYRDLVRRTSSGDAPPKCVVQELNLTKAVASGFAMPSKHPLGDVAYCTTIAPSIIVTQGSGEFQHVGHRNAVTCVSASADELISSSVDGTVRVWRRGKEVACFTGHIGAVWQCAVLGPETKSVTHIASVAGDRTLRVWDVRGEACVRVIKSAGTSYVSVAALTESLAVVCDASGRSSLFDLRQSKAVRPDLTFGDSTLRTTSVHSLSETELCVVGDGAVLYYDLSASKGTAAMLVSRASIHSVFAAKLGHQKSILAVGSKAVQMWSRISTECEESIVLFETDTQILHGRASESEAIKIITGTSCI